MKEKTRNEYQLKPSKERLNALMQTCGFMMNQNSPIK
jgi:hypothetical protein